MGRPVKREPPPTVANGGRLESERDLRAVKRERTSGKRVGGAGLNEFTQQGTMDRRVLRSKYLVLHNKIKDERDDMTRVDSETFASIIKEVEDLHQLVQKPREQVADAEALLDITNTLITSVKSQSNEGITAADFVSSFLARFGESRSLDSDENAPVSVKWEEFGIAVSPIFAKCHGFNTMMGPMKTELKQRKAVVQRRHTTRPTEKSKPEEVKDRAAEEKTDTEKNIHTMFAILRKAVNKSTRLESVILNRKSFAQTVENLFALSFLVKDGRVMITVDESGSHFVLAKNAPDASSVMSGEASYKHFVFRFDFRDWKLMKDMVPEGLELMPHRVNTDASQMDPESCNPQESLPRTPIRKLSRNRGLVIQEQVVEDSPEVEDGAAEATGLRRCKRKLV